MRTRQAMGAARIAAKFARGSVQRQLAGRSIEFGHDRFIKMEWGRNAETCVGPALSAKTQHRRFSRATTDDKDYKEKLLKIGVPAPHTPSAVGGVGGGGSGPPVAPRNSEAAHVAEGREPAGGRWDIAQAVADSIFLAAGGTEVLASLSGSERAAHLVHKHNWHPHVAHKVSASFASEVGAQQALLGVWEEGASAGADSVLALYDDAVRKFKHRPFLGYWIMDTLYPLGAWKTISYYQLSLFVHDIRQLLSDLHIRKGSRVAVVSRNSVEWVGLALATYGLQASLVAIPEDMAEEDWRAALLDAKPHVIWCSGKQTYDKVVRVVEKEALFLDSNGLLKAHTVMCIDGIDGFERNADYALTHRLTLFRERKENRKYVERIAASYPDCSDVALITYVLRGSGAVSRVEYTHAMLLASVLASEVHNPIHESDASLSLVPWSEGSALVHELLACMRKGARVYACEGLHKLRYNCQELAPTMVHSRYDGFEEFAEDVERAAVHEKLYASAFSFAVTHGALKASSPGFLDRVKAFVARRCLGRVRPLIGGKRLRLVVCHGRAFPPAADRIFAALRVHMQVFTGQATTAHALPFTMHRTAQTLNPSLLRRVGMLLQLGGNDVLLPKPLRHIPASPPRPLAGIQVEAKEGGEIFLKGAAVLLEGVLSGVRGVHASAHRVEVSSGAWGEVEVEVGTCSIGGSVALRPGGVMAERVEAFVVEQGKLIRQACVLVKPHNQVLVVAVPDFDALYELHKKRTNAEFRPANHHLLADYTLRELCEKQMDDVLELLRSHPVLASSAPSNYLLVAEEFTVLGGTLSPNCWLEPRRDAIARLHVH